MGNMMVIADFRVQILWKWMLGWKPKIAEALSEHSEYAFKNILLSKRKKKPKKPPKPNNNKKVSKPKFKNLNPANFEHVIVVIWLLTLGPSGFIRRNSSKQRTRV